MSEVHHIVPVRLKPRMTILLKCRMLFAMPATIENGRADSRVACFRQFTFMAQPLSRPRGELPHRRAAVHLTTRLNGSCLCAISQLGSYMSCRSWSISRSNGCICSVCIECRSELAAIPMTDYAGCRLLASCFVARRSRLRCSGRFSHSIISSSNAMNSGGRGAVLISWHPWPRYLSDCDDICRRREQLATFPSEKSTYRARIAFYLCTALDIIRQRCLPSRGY
jgi:hypothetical protein